MRAIATISKTSGEAIPAANNPEGTYPAAAFAEAIELIDEVSPRGAFKELRSKVRSMLGEAKRG